MSSFSIDCPACERRLVLPDRSMLGKQAKCPNCQHRFVLEVAEEAVLPEIRTVETPSEQPRTSTRSGSGSTQRRGIPRWGPLIVTAVLGAVAVAVMLLSAGDQADVPADGEPAAVADDGANGPDSSDRGKQVEPAPAAGRAVGTIRVESTPPGATVLVDDQRVYDEQGKLQPTPCIVTISKGPHAVTIVRDGFQDQVRQVSVGTREVDVIFEAGRKGESVLRTASWFAEARVGEPLPLKAINAVGRQRDPWLSVDGLSLWFVADRTGGQGVFFATRPSPFHDFDEPRLVPVTRGRDRRASPSVTARGLLVYAVPEKASLWAASRSGPLSPFDDKRSLISSPKATPRWTAAQVLGGGRHLYWRETTGKTIASFHAGRAETDAPFEAAEPFDMPGSRPCLSADGLRQFVFDGKTLVRWRRSSLRGRFARDETVATLELAHYVDDPDSRQFTVSDDERWMIFCDDPRDGGRLFLVRLHERPFWGVVAVGRLAPPRAKVARVDPKKQAVAKTPAPGLVIDPKALKKKKEAVDSAKTPPKPVKVPPLAVSGYRVGWRDLLAARDYEGASKYLATARRDPGMSSWAEEIGWDAEELAHVLAFWKDVRRVVAALKPGDLVRIGSVRLKFVRFEAGLIVAQGRSKPVKRPLTAMTGSDLVGILEPALAADDRESRLRAGIFLFHDLKGRGSSAKRRLVRGGPAGAVFLDRRGLRLLSTARAEIARGRPERALPLLAEIEKSFSRTSAVKKLPGVWADLYSLAGWSRLGARQWKIDGTAWRAAPGRAARALLVSPREMARFELTLEWKTEGENGQGGVFFRYPGSGATSNRSFKVQLSSDFGIDGDQFSTGALFAVAPPEVNAVKETGEWNTLKLRVDGEAVVIEINGRAVLKTSAENPEIPVVGHVALDGVAGGITYRKVLLVPLPGR
ncbi:MAG: hypothetical protein CMJ65_18370 [Planctomycetaceae bacterium]|nr:hypothetical protein [Planctomycetaceae bacterium]